MSAPLTTIKICEGVRINSKYEHSLWFENAEQQQNYFTRKTVKSFARYSFIRREWTLKVEATMLEAKAWNYLYFQNTPDPKYYYYFINEIRYVNEKTVELFLEMDVIQTYLFDFDLLPCFVERQHTESDEIGEHTLEEGIDTGELLEYESADITELNDLAIVILSTSELITATGTNYNDVYGTGYDSIYSGLGIYAVKAEKNIALTLKLADIAGSGATEGIVSLFLYPRNLLVIDENDDWDDDRVSLFKQVTGTTSISFSWNLPPMRYNALNGYAPRNKKLFCYPYNMMTITNNAGSTAVFKFERTKADYTFFGCKITGSIGAESGSVRLDPLGYNQIKGGYNYEYGLSLGAFPTCAWNNDSYKIWLAQNQNTLQTQTAGAYLGLAGAAVATLGSAVTGNILGAVGGAGAMIGSCHKIYGQIAAMKDREVQPNQAKGHFSASVNIVNKKQTFTLIAKCVSDENARVIDDFFTMYGYKLNRVQIPNIHARELFTYVKTVGCIVKGNLNNADRVKVENIFDNGVTFWTDGEYVGGYTLDNPPLESEV